jgi:metal-dependent amidase/aminoacylase/carboxypeptidase family protein
VLNALQTVVSREVDPLDAAVLTIGKIRGGHRYNATADRVTLEGTVRTFQPETKETIKERFHSIVSGVAASLGAVARISYWDGYPAAINSPEWAERVRTTARQLLGLDATPEIEPSLGGEDFGRFLQKYPGAYFRLGTADRNAKEEKKPLARSPGTRHRESLRGRRSRAPRGAIGRPAPPVGRGRRARRGPRSPPGPSRPRRPPFRGAPGRGRGAGGRPAAPPNATGSARLPV